MRSRRPRSRTRGRRTRPLGVASRTYRTAWLRRATGMLTTPVCAAADGCRSRSSRRLGRWPARRRASSRTASCRRGSSSGRCSGRPCPRAAGPRPAGRRRPDRGRSSATSVEHGRLRRRVIGGDEAIELDAIGDRVGLVRGEQRVERLDDVRPGSRAASSSAFEGSVSIVGPSAPNAIRLVTSTTGLPATASPISAAIVAALVNGDGEDDDVGARRRRRCSRRRPRAPVAAATAPASLRFARGDDDVVTGPAERGGEGAADVAGSDDRDLHDEILRCGLTSWLSSSRLCCGHNDTPGV